MAKESIFLEEAYETLQRLSADDIKRLEYEAREEALRELSLLRAGPAGEKIHSGIEKLTGEGGTVHVNLYGYSH